MLVDCFCARIICTVIVLLGLAVSLQAQQYPDWFLNPTLIHCTNSVTGIAEKSFLSDSVVNYAICNGLRQQNINKCAEIQAETSYWGTEAGKYCLWRKYEETPGYTIMNTQDHQRYTKKIYKNENLVFVLLVDTVCNVSGSDDQLINITSMSTPQWVEHIPESSAYWYAVGIAPKYYYETSSWFQAEQEARKYLAFSKGISIRDLTKVSRSGESKQVLEVEVEVKNIEVIARWRSRENDLFYCLLRCPKQ